MIDHGKIARLIIQRVADDCRHDLSAQEASLVRLVQRAAWTHHALQARLALLLPIWRPDPDPHWADHRDAPDIKWWTTDYQEHWASLPKRQRQRPGKPPALVGPMYRAVHNWWRFHQQGEFKLRFSRVEGTADENGELLLVPGNAATTVLALVIWNVCDPEFELRTLRRFRDDLP